MLRALDGLPLRRAALVGWCAGLGAHLALFTWLATATARLGELHPATATLAFVGWASFASLQLALVGAVDACARATAPRLRRVLFACAFVTAELVWPQVIPWTIGLPQQALLPLAQVAELGGAALLTFVVAFGAAGLDAAIDAAVDLARARPIPRQAIIDVSCAAAMLVAALSFGAWRLAVVREPASRTARVAIVQPGIVDNSITPHSVRELQANLERLAREVGADGGVALAVFPESAAPRPILELGDTSDRALRADAAAALADLARLARLCRCPTLVGGVALRVGEARTIVDRRNVALLFDDKGTLVDRYDKHELLALAEHLPGEATFPWLRRLAPFAGRFTAGPGPQVLRADDLSLAPLICFEAVPGAPAREALARGDVDLLVNSTNDVWFGEAQGPQLHALAVSLRAIETRRTLIRATTTGLSFAALPDGTRVAETPLSQAALRIVDVPLPRDPTARTPYARGGHLFSTAAALALGLILFAGRRLAHRDPDGPKASSAPPTR